MEKLNVETRLLKILDLDLKIMNSFYKKVCFNDGNLEKLYEKIHVKNELFLQGNKIIAIGWICILIYIYFSYYRIEIFSLCCLVFLSNLYLITIKETTMCTKTKSLIQVLSVTIFLNFKVLYLNYLTYIYDEDNGKEILRSLIYDFVSNNLLTLLVMDDNIFPKLIFVSLNLFSSFISKIFEKSPDSIGIDALTGLFYTWIFHLMKKALENYTRSIFSERYCLEKLLCYTNDFILELNGLHFNRNLKESIASGKNIKEFFPDILEKKSENKENGQLNGEEKFDIVSIPDFNFCTNFMKSFKIYTRNPNSKNEMEANLHILLESIYESTHNNKKFINLGIFQNNVSDESIKKYFEVYYRKFYLEESRVIDDLFFYDVTNYINSLEKIDEESRIKQKVFAKISHEFKTPLNSIVALIEDISSDFKKKDKIQLKKNLENIKNLSKYVIYLTNDIIQFCSMSDMNAIKYESQEINIREILEFGNEILICLLRCTGSKTKAVNPVINIDKSIDEVLVLSDEIRIKQLLLNFISNAVKFTKRGSILIDAKCVNETSSILISITDTGVGIKEEDQKKLFQEFSMIQNNQVNNSFGTGLGLSVCKNLSNCLNIKISFTSEYGKGSTFSFSIPYLLKRKFSFQVPNILSNMNRNPLITVPKKKKASRNNNFSSSDGDDESSSDNDSSNSSMEKSPLKFDTNEGDTVRLENFPNKISFINLLRFKILVVDDNSFINNSVKSLIEKTIKKNKLDYEVVIASDGIEILQLIKEDQSKGNLIKCIFTDENMEYLNGSEAAKIIKKLEKQNKIFPVDIVSLTSHDDIITKKFILECGFNYILSKPLKEVDLEEILKKLKII